jgi:hypothetical protein
MIEQRKRVIFMYLKFANDIENNVFITEITIDALGTDQLSEDEEREILRDFPSKIAYRNLVFTKNVKINGTVPEVTDDEIGEGVISVSLPTLSNKEILLDKDFKAVYKVDINKIPNAVIDSDVLTTKELVAQAYCAVFDAVIKEAVEKIMIEIRAKAPSFSGETIVSV